MLKIVSTTPKKEEHSKIKKKKRSGSVKQKASSFDTTLNTKIAFDFQGTIENLLNDLKEEERNFLDRQTIYELNRYKSLVQKILKTILISKKCHCREGRSRHSSVITITIRS